MNRRIFLFLLKSAAYFALACFALADDCRAQSVNRPSFAGRFRSNVLDSVLCGEISTAGVPGAVVAVVRGGTIRYRRGFGVLSLETSRPVDVFATCFRSATVSRLLTTLALLSLMRGCHISSATPVRSLLDDSTLSFRCGNLTLHDLLTQSTGLPDCSFGGLVSSSAAVPPIETFLRQRMPPARKTWGNPVTCGRFSSALAAAVVERLARESYENYVQRMLQTLGLRHTAIVSALSGTERAQLAVSHEIVGNRCVPLQPSFTAISAHDGWAVTAEDAARLMIAILRPEQSILDSARWRAMLSPQFSPAGDFRPITYGFFEETVNGFRCLVRSDCIDGAAGGVILLPEQDLGIFYVLNTAEPRLGARLTELILSEVLPPAQTPRFRPAVIDRETLERIAGTYCCLECDETTIARSCALFGGDLIVAAENNGLLTIEADGGERSYHGMSYGRNGWKCERNDDSLLIFRNVDGKRMAFGVIGGRTLIHVGDGEYRTFERIAWHDSRALHRALVFVFLLVLPTAAVVAFHEVCEILQQHRNDSSRRAGLNVARHTLESFAWLAVGVSAILHALFLGLAPVVARNHSWSNGFPSGLHGDSSGLLLIFLLAIPAVAHGIAVLGLFLWLGVSTENDVPSKRRRLWFAAILCIVLLFVIWLDHWKLFGFHFGRH